MIIKNTNVPSFNLKLMYRLQRKIIMLKFLSGCLKVITLFVQQNYLIEKVTRKNSEYG